MKYRAALVIIALVGLCPLGTPAQPAPEGPAPEMKKLEFLIGRWSAQMKSATPGSGAWTETWDARWASGGRYVRIERTAKNPQGVEPREGEGLMLIAYDYRANTYRAWEFSLGAHPNVPPGPMEYAGVFEDTKLVWTLKSAPEPTVPVRVTFEPKSRTEFSLRSEAKKADRHETVLEALFIARG
jgi:hypothetical protein